MVHPHVLTKIPIPNQKSSKNEPDGIISNQKINELLLFIYTGGKRRKIVEGLPLVPAGENDVTFKDHIKRIQQECEKTSSINQSLVRDLMDRTFALRRRAVILDKVPTKDLLKDFPCLKWPGQVS